MYLWFGDSVSESVCMVLNDRIGNEFKMMRKEAVMT
jgi:hypothetical protein